MANVIKTLEAGDIVRKAQSILHNNLVFSKTMDRQYDDRFARSGAKNGGTLLIREPNQFTIRSGQTMDTQDVTESTKTLTIATQRGVDINFSSVELTLSLDDFAERILKPAMSRLAAEVDKINIDALYPYVYKFRNTTPGTLPVAADILIARSEISQGLAPTGDRHFLTDALGSNSIITSSSTYYNPSNEISRQYEQGSIGRAYGFKFWETEMVPTHTAGTRISATPTCYTTTTTTAIGSAGFYNGRASIIVTSGSTGTTILAGDVFTVAGIYAVNPETKVTCAWEQQWSITADTNVTTAATAWPVSPTPYITGAKQNCVRAYVEASIAATVQVSTDARTTNTISTARVHLCLCQFS